MTLITFQSRIHFASHVLEEALRAELEEHDHRSILIVCDASEQARVIEQQVMIGLPARVNLARLEIGAEATKFDTRAHLDQMITPENFDAVIAFGSARAIRHGRICRQSIAGSRYRAQPSTQRARLREREFLPWFCAIPGVEGLPDPCLSTATSAGYKTTPPSVIICDPTLIADADAADEARAIANALGRCLAALGYEAFNPMADGLAFEGLRRLQLYAQLEESDRPGRSRELMAAMLNGAIAQQKGPGLIQILAHALNEVTGQETDSGSLQSVLLPRLLREREVIPVNEEGRVARILGLSTPAELPDAVERLLSSLPLARALRELKITMEDIRAAVSATQRSHGIWGPINNRMVGVFEQHY